MLQGTKKIGAVVSVVIISRVCQGFINHRHNIEPEDGYLLVCDSVKPAVRPKSYKQ